MTGAPIKDAATVLVIRDRAGPRPSVLMGMRGSSAVFMPEKFVFPGGRVDEGDADVPLACPIQGASALALRDGTSPGLAHALQVAAIRELWEETGLALGRPGGWTTVPSGWEGFAAAGQLPDASALGFVFRAITPPGSSRRFDARFFTLDAARLACDLDDFSGASGELSALQWVPLDQARALALPFITEVVLAEVAAALPRLAPAGAVPFFRNSDEESLFLRLEGRALP